MFPDSEASPRLLSDTSSPFPEGEIVDMDKPGKG